MATRASDTQQPGSARNGDFPYRVLIVANEAIGDDALVRVIVRHTEGKRAQARIVAPATPKSPLDLAAGDVDDDIQAARRRLEVSVDALREAGIEADGAVGEADPNLALEDGLRMFPADEVVMVVHPEERRTWLEQDVVDRARESVRTPITVIEVESGPGAPRVKGVREVDSVADDVEARRAQEAFEATYLPPMPTRDKFALAIGPLGFIALALLAMDCEGLDNIGVWDFGCYVSWIGAAYALVVTAIHVPAILALQGQRYARGLRNFMSISVVFIVPLLVLIAAVAVLVSGD